MAELVTFEEASKCPKCDVPGEDLGVVRRTNNNGKVHRLQCINPSCNWFETNWVVQVNEDNTVPVRPAGAPKEFPQFSPLDPIRAAEAIRRINDNEERK